MVESGLRRGLRFSPPDLPPPDLQPPLSRSMSSPRWRYSETEKGKGIRADSSTSINRLSGPKLLDAAIRAHRGAPGDVASLSSDRIEVAGDAEERFERISDCDLLANDGVVDIGKEDAGGRSDGSAKKTHRLILFLYRCDQPIEQLLDLSSRFLRLAVVQGQSWNGVLPTRSTFKSVSSLLKECRARGVEFIILRPDQRPWAPPIGFQCVYESFFQQDSKLWFLIPRLIAMTQLMTGAVRISVALIVMAAELDISMTVRIFEELTQIQPRPGGVYAVQMRSGLSILTGHPSRTKLWQRYYFYVKANSAAFEESSDDRFRLLSLFIRILSDHWILFGRTFRRSLYSAGSIGKTSTVGGSVASKNDWPSNVPCEETKRKRLKLPLIGKIPKSYPLQRHSRCSIGESFSAMTVAEEEDSDARGSPDGGGVDASAGEALVEGTIDQVSDARPSKKKMKKSKSSKRAKAGLEREREQEVEINQVEYDRLTDEVEGNREAAQTDNFEGLTEDGQVESLGSKRKRLVEHGVLESAVKIMSNQ
ncbi:hypothetical protein F2Q69_00060219 [Brassica cretica]|uniref:Uncharacterized protein n=1 Tax=Brassica cretica TaxID=69181 RepID=A0A8S9RE58_BRACR|nr:hypothetical protein F2Q69_00060219 [Brassica cretica]